MLHGSLSLLSLPEELIITVIFSCSVDDILNLENTCTSIRHLCQSRVIWLSLIQSLDVEQAPDLPPNQPLESLSSSDLKGKVIRAKRSYHRWNTEGCRISKQIELHVDVPLDATPSRLDPRLLPGGREVLVENGGRLELWSLVSHERLWTAPHNEGHCECLSFDFELAQDSAILNIAGIFVVPELSVTTLRIFCYDFQRHTAKLAFERDLPAAFVFHAMLRGDIFMATISRSFQTVMVNWKIGGGIFIDFIDSTTALRIYTKPTHITDDHLISIMQDTYLSVVAVPLSAMDGRWSQSKSFKDWEKMTLSIDEYEVLPLNFNDAKNTTENCPNILAMHTFKPTWIKNAPTEIYIVAYDRIMHKPKHTITYRLQLAWVKSRKNVSQPPNGHAPQQCRLSDNSADTNVQSSFTVVSINCAPTRQLPWNAHSISNTGRMFTLRDQLLCFSLFTDTMQPQNTLSLGSIIESNSNGVEQTITSVEPWSGAIVVGTPGLVRVIYLD